MVVLPDTNLVSELIRKVPDLAVEVWASSHHSEDLFLLDNQMNLCGPSPTGLSDGLWAVFLSCNGFIGMNLHDHAVHRYHFWLDLDELFLLDILENRLDNPTLLSTIHLCINGIPMSESG